MKKVKGFLLKNSLLLKRLAIVFLVLMAAMPFRCGRPSDREIRSKVVKLSSARGSCSGQQVMAASGIDYILTAGHCRALEVAGSILVTTEDGRSLYRRIVAEDELSDLLLLEGIPNINGLAVAHTNFPQQEVRTFTHGRGFDTYKTSGVLIQDYVISALISLNAEDCPKMPKYKVVSANTFFGTITACLLSVNETVTTAMIVPGSSGGAVVNAAGELVGVVSAGDGQFGYLVTLFDIKKFLSNY